VSEAKKALNPPRESPTAATEQPGRVENRKSRSQGAQKAGERPEERHSVWRRMFGG
jgi:hypothetical protein